MTKDWIEADRLLTDYDRSLRRYGETKTKSIFQQIFKDHTRSDSV